MLGVIAAIDGLFDQLSELEGRCSAETPAAETAETPDASAAGEPPQE